MKSVGEIRQQNQRERKLLGNIQQSADEKGSCDAVKQRPVLKQTQLTFSRTVRRLCKEDDEATVVDTSQKQMCSDSPLVDDTAQLMCRNRSLADAGVQTDCGSQSCAACSSTVKRDAVVEKNTLEELAEQFRSALQQALQENEALHSAYEDLRREYVRLSVRAKRATNFSLILKAIIEDAEDDADNETLENEIKSTGVGGTGESEGELR